MSMIAPLAAKRARINWIDFNARYRLSFSIVDEYSLLLIKKYIKSIVKQGWSRTLFSLNVFFFFLSEGFCRRN